jgi:glycosyltransferase involved in cell wall biosynthesis
MIAYHRFINTWNRYVDTFIALSDFARGKFIQSGLPAEKIKFRPNFVVSDPGVKEGVGSFVLFVGRLSKEKGIFTLLQAWKNICHIPLYIAGDGRLCEDVYRFVSENENYMVNVKILGRLDQMDITALYKKARFLVVPSGWYENFPMVIAESFASGLPVVATDVGAMHEIIENGKTGLHFALADANDLAEKASWLWTHPEEALRMGLEARNVYEIKFSSQTSYGYLLEIYESTLSSREGFS